MRAQCAKKQIQASEEEGGPNADVAVRRSPSQKEGYVARKSAGRRTGAAKSPAFARPKVTHEIASTNGAYLPDARLSFLRGCFVARPPYGIRSARGLSVRERRTSLGSTIKIKNWAKKYGQRRTWRGAD